MNGNEVFRSRSAIYIPHQLDKNVIKTFTVFGVACIYIPHQLDKNCRKAPKHYPGDNIYIPHQLDKNATPERGKGYIGKFTFLIS